MAEKKPIHLASQEANEVLANLLSVNHGWWCDFIEEYTGKDGKTSQRFSNTPYFSPSFLAMYGYTANEVSLDAIVAEEYQHSVILAMKEAITSPSRGVTLTISARTKSAVEKRVELYLRRIRLSDGRSVLASLHSDLTVSTNAQWIDRTVLQKLQAFVFVKRWDKARDEFVFEYMNSRLSQVLGLASPDMCKEKSDKDFFDNLAQRAGFRRVDEAIRDAVNQDLVIVHEESFTPRQPPGRAEREIQTRLLTFKTPFWRPSNGPRSKQWEVLGIAVNITSVTDVLRAVADKSDDALYIKDAQCRYRYVNQHFLDILGASHEDQVLNCTFSEVLAVLRTRADHSELEALVRSEDMQVLGGKSTVNIRTAMLHDGTESLSEKLPIRAQDGSVSHILGITSQLFPGKLGSILDRIPQCLAVKKYCPTAGAPAGRFRYVWANRSFLRLHNYRVPYDIVGKTDYDFWLNEEADRYRAKDQQVVDIYMRRLHDATVDAPLSPDNWEEFVAELRSSKCWEFRETQRGPHTVTRILQTSKWVEAIPGSGTLFLVVVYSDVTKGDLEQQRSHHLTVHNINAAIAPIDAVKIHLDRYRDGKAPADEAVLAALDCIRDVSENLEFFEQHHLDLLRMRTDCKSHSVHILVNLVGNEAAKAQRYWRKPVRISSAVDERALATVECDLVFMRCVLSEMILNAMRAIKRREGRLAVVRSTQGRNAGPYDGMVGIRLALVEGYMVCVVSDNGAACSDPEERGKLEQAYAEACNDPYDYNATRLGLPFCVLAMQAQRGKLRLETDRTATELSIHMRMA